MVPRSAKFDHPIRTALEAVQYCEWPTLGDRVRLTTSLQLMRTSVPSSLLRVTGAPAVPTISLSPGSVTCRNP